MSNRIPSLVLGLLVLNAARATNTEVVTLSGTGPDDARTWDFRFDPGDGRGPGDWTTIPLPAHWEIQGFGRTEYGHVKFEDKAPEVGHYRTHFRAPAAWRGRVVRLVFGGVMTDTEARVNGRPAGPRHQGGFTEFRYDITDLLRFGTDNELTVTVYKVSANERVTRAERCADFWTLAGIYRPVWLEVLPQQFIDWVSPVAEADGRFRAEVHLAGITDADRLTVTIRPRDGGAVVGEATELLEPGRERATIALHVDRPRTWSAETPSLYRARFDLKRGGTSIHTLTHTIGFRSLDVRAGQGLFLNGQRIVLRGADRHCFDADTGRVLSAAMSRRDIEQMQAMNMNAVRCSHYPPDRHFLDLCDELGLYVLDELTGWQKPPYDTETGRRLVRETVVRDSAHPSILFWDNGNEGGWNPELDAEFARWDAQDRPVLHPWESLSGINTAHYLNYEQHVATLAGHPPQRGQRHYVAGDLYLPTEFLHGLYDGGHGAGLDDYWRAVVDSPLGAGGFLWALKDESLVRSDLQGQLDSAGIAAPDGILGPRAEQAEGSFRTIQEIWSPVYIERRGRDLRDDPGDGLLPVANRYSFTNLRDCTFLRRLLRLPGPGQLSDPEILQQVILDSPDVAPAATGTLDLERAGPWDRADVLALSAFDPRGRELFTWTWPLREPDGRIRRLPAARHLRRSVAEEGGDLVVRADDRVLRFDAASGRLREVTVAGRTLPWGRGPVLSVLPRPESVAGDARVTWSAVAGSPEIRARGGGLDFAWTVRPDGVLQLDYAYDLPSGDYAFAGISFDCPEAGMRGMQWAGDGPYRVYRNRRKGTAFGVHRLFHNDAAPGRVYDYPNFKGYFANLYWVDFRTDSGRIEVATDRRGLFLRTYTPRHDLPPLAVGQSPKSNRGAKVPYPEGDISFLNAIPAIGTKFKRAADLGPQSRPAHLAGRITGRLYLRFR